MIVNFLSVLSIYVIILCLQWLFPCTLVGIICLPFNIYFLLIIPGRLVERIARVRIRKAPGNWGLDFALGLLPFCLTGLLIGWFELAWSICIAFYAIYSLAAILVCWKTDLLDGVANMRQALSIPVLVMALAAAPFSFQLFDLEFFNRNDQFFHLSAIWRLIHGEFVSASTPIMENDIIGALDLAYRYNQSHFLFAVLAKTGGLPPFQLVRFFILLFPLMRLSLVFFCAFRLFHSRKIANFCLLAVPIVDFILYGNSFQWNWVLRTYPRSFAAICLILGLLYGVEYLRQPHKSRLLIVGLCSFSAFCMHPYRFALFGLVIGILGLSSLLVSPQGKRLGRALSLVGSYVMGALPVLWTKMQIPLSQLNDTALSAMRDQELTPALLFNHREVVLAVVLAPMLLFRRRLTFALAAIAALTVLPQVLISLPGMDVLLDRTGLAKLYPRLFKIAPVYFVLGYAVYHMLFVKGLPRYWPFIWVLVNSGLYIILFLADTVVSQPVDFTIFHIYALVASLTMMGLIIMKKIYHPVPQFKKRLPLPVGMAAFCAVIGLCFLFYGFRSSGFIQSANGQSLTAVQKKFSPLLTGLPPGSSISTDTQAWQVIPAMFPHLYTRQLGQAAEGNRPFPQPVKDAYVLVGNHRNMEFFRNSPNYSSVGYSDGFELFCRR